MPRPQRGKKRRTGRSKLLFRRRKFCKFCDDKVIWIDYREPRLLLPYAPERGKIQPRRTSGTCATHQRQLRLAIHRARNLALISFTSE